MLLFSSFIFSVAVLAFGHFHYFKGGGVLLLYLQVVFYLYLSLIRHNSFDPKQAKWHAPGCPHVKAPRKLIPFVMSPSLLEPGNPIGQDVAPRQRSNRSTEVLVLNQGLPGRGFEIGTIVTH